MQHPVPSSLLIAAVKGLSHEVAAGWTAGLYSFCQRYVEDLKASWKEAEQGEENVLESVWDLAKDLTAGHLADNKLASDELQDLVDEDPLLNRIKKALTPDWFTWFQPREDLKPMEGNENITLELGLLTLAFFWVFIWALNSENFLSP